MDILNTRAAEARPAPPLPAALRATLVRDLRADLRRDEASAHYLRLARQPIGALLARIADTRATLAEIEGTR